MVRLRAGKALLVAISLLSPLSSLRSEAQSQVPLSATTYQYSVEWRLVYAGTARLTEQPSANKGIHAVLHLESSGMVAKLFRVADEYSADYDDGFCASSSYLNAQEGKRHRETKVTFDRDRKRAIYLERDLLKNTVVQAHEIDIPACVQDVVGGLLHLRDLHLEPGQSTQLPISDGKKFVMAKVEAQEREELHLKSGIFKTIRYEAYLFDGVLYKRKAHLNIWLTDDARKLPVQLRVRLQFTIGTITLQLEKEEHT